MSIYVYSGNLVNSNTIRETYSLYILGRSLCMNELLLSSKLYRRDVICYKVIVKYLTIGQCILFIS